MLSTTCARFQHSEQGSKAILYIVRNQKRTKAFFVKSWNFVGAGSYPSPWSHIFHSECVVLPGVPGQRNPNPPPAFFNHFIVIHGGKFYDPFYGSTPFIDQTAWENASIDGLFKRGTPMLAGYKKSAHSTTNLLKFYNMRTGVRI